MYLCSRFRWLLCDYRNVCLINHVKNKKNEKTSIAYLYGGRTIFTVCLIAANIVAQKPLLFRTQCYGCVVGVPDFVHRKRPYAEVWGYRKARFIIWFGFLMNFFVVLIFQLSILIPPNQFYPHQDAFSQVLGSSLRLTFASFISFLLGSFVNAYIMSKLKNLQKGKGFSVRAIVTTYA